MRLPSATAIPLDPASATPHAKIEHAARQLESQFARMLIKSMRSASMGDPMLGDNTTYREMYDQKLSDQLTKGRGLGLAPMIMRQLERSTGQASPTASGGGLPLPLQRNVPMALPVNADPLLPLPARGAIPTIAPLTLAPTSHGVSLQATAPLAPPPPAPACDPDAPLDCSSPEAFVRSLWPHAQKTAAELGVPAKALIAQAALETGWGRRLVGSGHAVTSHNLFGIKAGAHWVGEKVSAATHEFVNGVRVAQRAAFRAYGSAGESFADYAHLLSNPRYAAARGTGDDAQRFAQALQHAGYATDPSYAAKIAAIANGPTLQRALASLPVAASPGVRIATSAVAAALDQKG
jgi:flagellar protein FlgJ